MFAVGDSTPVLLLLDIAKELTWSDWSNPWLVFDRSMGGAALGIDMSFVAVAPLESALGRMIRCMALVLGGAVGLSVFEGLSGLL